MADNIEQTIKKIEDDLKENEVPLPPVPKGVATQHAIDARPVELTPEMFAIMTGERQDSDREVGFSFDGSPFQLPRRSLFESMQASSESASEVLQAMAEGMEQAILNPSLSLDTAPHEESSIDESSFSYEVSLGTSAEASIDVGGTLERMQLDWVESAQERYQELESLASLPGLDLSTVISHHQQLLSLRCNHNGFQIRCQDCGFLFRSNDVEAYDLAQLHANRNKHHVSFIFDLHGMHYDLDVVPEKRNWGERIYGILHRFYYSNWFVIPLTYFIGSSVYSIFNQSGLGRALNILLLGLWLFNLYQWGKYKWEHKSE